MASTNSTWREHPFVRGHAYRALQSFDGRGFQPGVFVAGRIYVFENVGYSHYDGASIFMFGGDEPVQWWWPDGDPDSLPFDRFGPVVKRGEPRIGTGRLLLFVVLAVVLTGLSMGLAT